MVRMKRLKTMNLGVVCFEGAMDLKLLEALFWKGVPVFDMRSNMSMIDVGWGTPIFHKMGREKVILVNAFLSFGYELLMCDTDMVFLQVCYVFKSQKVPLQVNHNNQIKSNLFLKKNWLFDFAALLLQQNPLPYFERFPSADVLTSSDEVVNSVDDDSLEIWDRSKHALLFSHQIWS